MQHLIELIQHASKNLATHPEKRHVYTLLTMGLIVLNTLILILVDTNLALAFFILNLWFISLATAIYFAIRSWLKIKYFHVKATEQWAENYLKTDPEHQTITQFNQGAWPVSDAILALDQALQRQLNTSLQIDTQMRSRAFLDEQTGIGNRIYFDHRIEAYLAQREEGQGGCLYLIHLNELDIVQMEIGEQQVAIILNYLVNLTTKFVDEYHDSVFARRSDCDFTLLIPDIDVENAQNIASCLIRLCDRIPLPKEIDDDHFFHIGIANLTHCDTPYQALAEADMALRAAQLQGPSNWFMYDKDQIDKNFAKGSAQWRSTIDIALSKHAFVLLFQPVMLTDNTINHHNEILARMRNNNGQLVNASIFLPMAQKLGMINRIDQLMVEKTVNLLNYENGAQDICSLNLHIDSLLECSFQNWLLTYLQSHPKVTNRIIIEVSEYPLVTHGKSLVSFFAALHKVGIRLLIDHVGLYVLDTSYIRHYSVDYLKLHVSVVRNIDTRPENQLFVKSLLAACTGTSVLVFGLGVERIGEWVTLQKLGIAGAQGHYFTEPLESLHQISSSY